MKSVRLQEVRQIVTAHDKNNQSHHIRTARCCRVINNINTITGGEFVAQGLRQPRPRRKAQGANAESLRISYGRLTIKGWDI